MKGRITSKLVCALKPKARPYEVVDDKITGFLARVQSTGVISYYFAYRTSDGRRARHKLGKHPGVTAPAARKAAEHLAAEVVKGGDPHEERKERRAKRERDKHSTLGAFINERYAQWALTHQRRGQETLQLLEGNFSHLYTKKMDKITQWDLQKWRSEKDKLGLKATTINRRVGTLKAVLNKAVEWDVIAANPIHRVKPLKVDAKSRIRYLTDEEEARLREALDERERDLREGRESGNRWRSVRGYDVMPPLDGKFADHLKPMVLLAINTGLRRGEVFNLRWRDVDFDRRLLTVEGATAKSQQTRHVHLNSEAIAVLGPWRQQNDDELVFTSPVSGERFDNIKHSWERLRENAGIPDFRFHDLRHTFASKLVMASADLYTVKELMGHSTIQMTERYAHLAPEHRASAVERIVRHETETQSIKAPSLGCRRKRGSGPSVQAS